MARIDHCDLHRFTSHCWRSRSERPIYPSTERTVITPAHRWSPSRLSLTGSNIYGDSHFPREPSPGYPMGQGVDVTDNDGAPSRSGGGRLLDKASLPLVIATMHREEGITGVQTHVRQLRQYLERRGMTATLFTPFSWGGLLTVPVFGPRLILARFSGPASVVWHRHWHEVFLHNALRRRLAEINDCVIYAQGPLAARAALRARRGPYQRVI